MTPEIKQRVIPILGFPPILYLRSSESSAFFKAVESAKTFADIPKQYQTMIESAEEYKKAYPLATGDSWKRFTWTPEEIQQGLETKQ